MKNKTLIYFISLSILSFGIISCSDTIKSNMDEEIYIDLGLSSYTVPANNSVSISTNTNNLNVVFNKTLGANTIPITSVNISIDNILMPDIVSQVIWTGSALPNDTIRIVLKWNSLPENTAFTWELLENSLIDMYGRRIMHDRITGSFTTGQKRALTFTDNGNTVSDSKTGLIWKKCADGLSGLDCSSGLATTTTWVNASTTCNNLNGSNYQGRNDWRLPSIEELLTIINYSAMLTANFENFFPNAPQTTSAYSFWSSTYNAESLAASSTSWVLHTTTNYGYTWWGSVNTKKFTMCVAGAPMATSSFADQNNGTVKDNTTGYIWQKCNIGETYLSGSNTCTGTPATLTWYDALDQCGNLDLGGRSDWRLPTMDEHNTIINYQTWDASETTLSPLFSKPPHVWSTETPVPLYENIYQVYWAATTPMYESIFGWEVQMRCGYTGYTAYMNTKKSPWNFARCVTGP